MKVSEKSLELNVGAELLAHLRGPLNMPKAYLRGVTQQEEYRTGVDFFARLPDRARIFAFQFKAPRGPSDNLPYKFTLARHQHTALCNLAVQDPSAVYYVFPFYVLTHKLLRDVPNLARDTWLLPVARLPPTVFAGQRTKRVCCFPGTAIVNPDYPMESLATLALSWEDGIKPDRFAEWYYRLRHHSSDLVYHPPRFNSQVVRGLRVTVIMRQD